MKSIPQQEKMLLNRQVAVGQLHRLRPYTMKHALYLIALCCALAATAQPAIDTRDVPVGDRRSA